MTFDNEYAKAKFYATVNDFVPAARMMDALSAELVSVRDQLAKMTEQRDEAAARVATLEVENRQLRKRIEDDIKWQNAYHAMTGE